MRYLLILLWLIWLTTPANAQSIDTIIQELQSINHTIRRQPCSNGKTALISNRAMNIFLADKTGYLSGVGELSYYTNYVTLRSSTGTLTINHNFQKAKGTDEPIQRLFGVGVKANVADGFNASFVDKQFKNQMGAMVNYTLLGKVKTTAYGCAAINVNNQSSTTANQKLSMDALRAGILHTLAVELKTREAAFNEALNHIDANTDVPGQTIDTAKAIIRKNFYEDLAQEYSEKFARLQAEALTKTNLYRTITTHWTTLSGYIPLAFPKYNVAASLTSPVIQQHPYPFSLSLSHTRLWEGSRFGRLFITLTGSATASNAVQSFALNKNSFADYRVLGGTDTIHLASLKNTDVYIGAYESFITPSILARVVYFPHDSHGGISLLLEQQFGKADLLNGRLAIPIVLINSKKLPALHVEMQVSFFDIRDNITAERKLGNQHSIGVEVGIPMSRLMY